MVEPQSRLVSDTEHSFCSAVLGGTGIAVLAILISKNPTTLQLENSLQTLQKSHPILRSKLHSNNKNTLFSFTTSQTPIVKLKSFNLLSTLNVLEKSFKPKNQSIISPLHLILEHELNLNSWCNNKNSSDINVHNILFATNYALPNEKWVIVLRLHAAACDRTTAVSLLKELLGVLVSEEKGRADMEIKNDGKVNLGIEDLIPNGKANKKTLWNRGVDMLGYSMNSLRLTNLKFQDVKSSRSSRVVRLQLNRSDTEKILFGCKLREIKLCGALGAAGLIAAQTTKNRVDKDRKYAIATMTDCRSLLEPPLSEHNFGFYHSVIMNTHVIKGGEKLWDLAKKVYMEFANYKKHNKQFTDMADLNFLMRKAINNPGLASSSALRSSILSVFEDSVIEYSDSKQNEIGIEDYMGRASVHGIGPSIAIFDTIRDGKLDCIFVYPSPLHSREQIQDFIDKMKTILVD